ncbi:MAG: hypothetical protein LQ347_003557 [Umbilicaria vellea]|nr:MAG: hypothetical protein LQ347_003557 [Umbilicaria vellea]
MELQKDVKLHQERDRQSKLNNWMEYQFYHYRKLEPLEKKFEQAQKGLESAQMRLSEAGVAGFEGEYELNDIGWALKNGQQEEKADGEMKLAEQEMELAEQRLKTAQSDGSRDTAERAALIGLAQGEVKAAEKRLDDIRNWRETIQLRGELLSALSELWCATTDLRQHKIILEWIDQQLSMIASECADVNQESKGSNHHHKDQAEMLESVP